MHRSLKSKRIAVAGATVIAGLLATAVLTPTMALAAPTADQCIGANEDGSVLRKRGKLIAAKKSLVACISEACPKVVREDCLRTLNELDRAIPTIQFKAMEGSIETFEVRVLVDNEPLLEKLGQVISVDPGEHIFTFLANSHPAQTRKITLKENEREHLEVIQLGPNPLVNPSSHLVVMSEPGAGIIVDGARTLGRFEGVMTPGVHVINVAKEGKAPVFFNVDMNGGETKLDVKLHDEKKGSYVPWVIGGAIVLAGILIGGGIAIAASK